MFKISNVDFINYWFPISHSSKRRTRCFWAGAGVDFSRLATRDSSCYCLGPTFTQLILLLLFLTDQVFLFNVWVLSNISTTGKHSFLTNIPILEPNSGLIHGRNKVLIRFQSYFSVLSQLNLHASVWINKYIKTIFTFLK